MGFTLYQTGMLPGLPKKLTFDEDGLTVENLFHLLSGRYGKNTLSGILDQDGNIEDSTMLVLNGVIIKSPKALQTEIPAGSELLITVLIAGG